MTSSALRNPERDRTSEFRSLCLSAKTDGLDVRSSQIMRPPRRPQSDFAKALEGVSSLISALRRILAESRAAELNADVEAQITEYVHRCKSNIDALQNLCVSGAQPQSKAQAQAQGNADTAAVSPMERAHRQGCVLILAERLKECMATFEGMQRARQARIEQAELAKRRRTPALRIASRKDSSGATVADPAHASMSRSNSHAAPLSPRSAQQQSFQSENYALQQDLSNLTDQAQHAERTVREIASLNQAFSAALFHQAEQIETLYNQAVEASHNMDMGNVQLKKTVKANSQSRKWIFVILVVFSLMLLFFDWWYG
jgi:syntaxin 18